MNVLSLFDGMSCGQIALERAGISVENYFSSEIDKYAIQITQKNYPNTIQLGDVQNWKSWKLPKIDLLLAGSPCQGFSVAGKGRNFDDPRSRLLLFFIEIRDYLLKQNPDLLWMLENVRMKKELSNKITELVEVEPVLIDSALVSAQSRKRLYWMNWKVDLPADKGIVLRDIIEETPDDRYLVRKGHAGHVRDIHSKAGTLTEGAHSGGNHSDMTLLRLAHGYMNEENIKTFKYPSLAAQDPSSKYLIQVWDNAYMSKSEYRRLTPLECERLQTVPDGYTDTVSNTQRYKMLGNGWTVDVIVHILSFITKENKSEDKSMSE
jgi:DNA-cytosine methyltransferase